MMGEMCRGRGVRSRFINPSVTSPRLPHLDYRKAVQSSQPQRDCKGLVQPDCATVPVLEFWCEMCA